MSAGPPSRTLSGTLAQALADWADAERPPATLLSTHPELAGPDGPDFIKSELDSILTAATDRAERYAVLLDVVARHNGHRRAEALALRGRAQILHVRGGYAQAAELYARAAQIHEALGEPLDAARTRKTRIDALMYLGRYAEGLEEGRRARAALRDDRDEILLAELDVHLGNLELRRGRLDPAIGHYLAAVRAFEGTGDALRLATARINLANAYVERLDVDAAAAAYDAASRAFREAGDARLVAEALYGRLFLESRTGRHARVVRDSETVARAFEAARHVRGEGQAIQLGAASLLALGQPGAALREVDRADRLLAFGGHHSERGRGDVIAARALQRLGRARSALRRLDEAVRRFRHDGAESAALAARLDAAAIQLALSDGGGAEATIAAVLGDLRRIGAPREVARGMLIASEAALVGGDGAGARAYLAEALAIMRHQRDPWFDIAARVLSGTLAGMAGRPKVERRRLAEACDVVEHVLDGISEPDLQMTFHRDHAAPFRQLIESLLDAADVRRAFDVSERMRARELRAALQRLGLGETTSDAVRRARESLTASAHGVGHATERRRAASAAGALARQGRAAAAHYDPSAAIALRQGEILIEFTGLREDYAAFILDSRGTVVARRLGPVAPVRRLVERLVYASCSALLGTGSEGEALMSSTLARLGERLLEPIAPLLPGDVSAVFVAAGDGLETVPFGALPLAGRGYLIDLAPLVRVPGHDVLLRLRQTRPTESRRVMIVAGSAEEGARIHEEGRELEALWGDDAEAVSPEAAADVLGSGGAWRVIHVAAHGAPCAVDPMGSGIQLGARALDVREVLRRRFDCATVVLSGCHTAAVDGRFGDELAGLVGGFLRAGARSVVASLWPVDGAATWVFMRHFHRLLRRDFTAERALREAACELRRANASPLAWAPWEVHGASRHSSVAPPGSET